MTAKLNIEHQRALERMDELEFHAAAEILEPLAKRRDPSWIVLNDLALCRSMTGETEKARELFDRILAREPANPFALINRFYVEEAEKIRSAPPPEPRRKIVKMKGEGPPNPRVTVIMPTFNRPELIRESLASVLAQTLKNWELIVVNDGGSREVEKTLASHLADQRLRYVYAEHGGTASALNIGLCLARGVYIAYLDDDDIYYPEHLATLSGFLDDRPDLEAAFSLLNKVRMAPAEKGGKPMSRSLGYSADIPFSAWRVQNQVPNRNPLMHRRELTDRIGGHCEAIQYAEDWEFYLRLVIAGALGGVDRITGELRLREGGEQKTRRPKGPRNHCRNLIVFIHGIFPLTGKRFANTGQGKTERLYRELQTLAQQEFDDLRSLELRKLIEEPYYSIFHRLGKDWLLEGRKDQARRMFRQARRVAPAEPRLWFRSVF